MKYDVKILDLYELRKYKGKIISFIKIVSGYFEYDSDGYYTRPNSSMQIACLVQEEENENE